MNFFQKIKAVFRNISLVQQALLIAIVLTFVIVGVLVTYWARRPDMRMLYRDLAPEEASKITEKIADKNIPYELRNGGTSIYVPEDKVYQLRLDVAKEGLPLDQQGGYKIFKKKKIGISPFVQNVNLKRALQDELAKSIQMIDGVVHARVHLVSTEQAIFSSQASQTSASVVLRLRAGYRLSASNIAAITHLVSGSVEGLKSEKVTVVDSQGRLLSGASDQSMASGAGTVADYKERVEQREANKIKRMLADVLGPGRATVSVSAEIDMTSINTVTETPIKGVPKKEEENTKSETKPGSVSADGATAIPGGSKKDSKIVTEFQHGKTVKQEVILPGEIKSLTVAAFVDLSPDDPNETKPIVARSDVEDAIKNALGPKLKPDGLKVVEARFNRPTEPLITEEPAKWTGQVATIARHSSLGIMAICALLVLKIFSGAKRKADLASTPGQLPGGEGGGAAGLLPSGDSGQLMLRKRIKDNPDQARELFSNWLQEEET